MNTRQQIIQKPRGSALFPEGLSRRGLVLYVPFWHPSMQGSSFISKDLNAATVTVTDATWGATGRSCTGNNSKLVAAQKATYPTGSATRSIVLWTKYNSGIDARDRIFSYGATSGTATSCELDINTGYLDFISGVNDKQSNLTITQDVWEMYAVTVTGTTIKFYVNENSQSTTLNQALNTTASDIWFGRSLRNNSNSWDGIIGAGWVYNCVLSGAEILSLYNAFKWRFQ